jgi:hypothetical protein
MENQLGAQGCKLTVEGLCERLHGTTRQSQTAATGVRSQRCHYKVGDTYGLLPFGKKAVWLLEGLRSVFQQG